jgi:NAD(P)-dependent dehydrogenase (short-subunit alcohol dehydrogenase family)
MPTWSLRDRTFLITGGARGIGEATPLAERQIVADVPEVLATYEREVREKGLQEVVWSERTRGVLRGD